MRQAAKTQAVQSNARRSHEATPESVHEIAGGRLQKHGDETANRKTHEDLLTVPARILVDRLDQSSQRIHGQNCGSHSQRCGQYDTPPFVPFGDAVLLHFYGLSLVDAIAFSP